MITLPDKIKKQVAQIVTELETLINSLEALADDTEESEGIPEVVDWDGETHADTMRLMAEELEGVALELSQL